MTLVAPIRRGHEPDLWTYGGVEDCRARFIERSKTCGAANHADKAGHSMAASENTRVGCV